MLRVTFTDKTQAIYWVRLHGSLITVNTAYSGGLIEVAQPGNQNLIVTEGTLQYRPLVIPTGTTIQSWPTAGSITDGGFSVSYPSAYSGEQTLAPLAQP